MEEPLKAARAKQKLGPNQRKWLKALESGKFAQTRKGALKTKGGSYCCLGVACELFKTERTKISADDGAGFPRVKFDGIGDVAPPFVIKALALYSDCADPNDSSLPKRAPALTEANDDGMRFVDIAARVRANPSVYFKSPK